jgi:transcriptional regulator with XRE-family HTH domain
MRNCILVLEVMIMIFSEKLQLIRKSKGMTQEDLAEKLTVSRQAVAKWESNKPQGQIMW